MTSTAANHPDDVRVVPAWELCDRLARSLRLVGISSIEVAEFMGVNPTTVSRWVNGRTMPSRAVLRIWADMTGVEFEWLETGQDPTGQPGPDDLRGCRDSNPEPSVLEPRHLTLVPERNTVRATLTPNRATVGQPILRLVEGF